MFEDRLVINYYDPLKKEVVRISLGELKEYILAVPENSVSGSSEKLPEMEWKKKKIRKWMVNNEVKYGLDDTKEELLLKIRYNRES